MNNLIPVISSVPLSREGKILAQPGDQPFFYIHGNGEFTTLPFEAVLAKAALGDAEWILFFHGYNETPKDIIAKAGTIRRLAAWCGRKVVVIPFLWGSRGHWSGYLPDKISSKQSGKLFAEVLWKLRSHQARFHVIAHSMGTRALKHALMHVEDGKTLFQSTHCVASDIPASDLVPGGAAEAISKQSKSVCVYHADDDRALRASPFVNVFAKGMVPRLGHRGPIGGFDNVQGIDCDQVNNLYDPLFGHSYFLTARDGQPGRVWMAVLQAIAGEKPTLYPPIAYVF